MLLAYGIGQQHSDWHVIESKAPMYARVYYILGGNTGYRSGPYTQELKHGWLYIFPPHTPYEMWTDPEHPLDCLYMHLDLRTASLPRLVSIQAEEDPQIFHMLQTIRDAIEACYPGGYLETLAQAFESLCLIKNLIQTVDAETGRYIDILRNTYKSNLPLKTIAASLGYSTEYFIRIFREKFGVSPHQYAISLRMSDAIRMLGGSATMDEIASAIGYIDGHSFANAFRKYYGISPGVYREHYTGFV